MSNHLTHQQMLAYLDGELPKPETARAREHLHSCWTCRIEMERLESDIAVILDAHNEEFAPAITPPPTAWPSFDALLARKLPMSPQPVWMRFGNAIRAMLTPAQGAVLAGLIVAAALFAFLRFGSKPVSAKEVLRSVQVADRQRMSIPPGHVIREKVHVRRKARGQESVQSGSVNAWESPTTALWQTSDGDSAVSALKEEYKTHGVPIDLPLSASSLEAWGKVAGGDPSVTKQGTDLNLSYAGEAKGSVDASPRVSLRIQPSTWHVEQMTLQFSDASFEVTEDDFSTVPTSDVPPVLLAALEPGPQLPAIAAARPVSSAMGSFVHLPEINLDEVQLSVLMALHRLHADLGEPVTVTHSSRKVEVGIWQLPPDRQNEIRMALQNEPGVLIETSPPAQRPPASVAPASPALSQPPTRVTVFSGDDSEDQVLLKFFGTDEKEQLYTRDVLEKSTVILAHLYALRNLQAQFPPEREQALSPSDRAQLDAIIKDHAAATLTAFGDLQAKLAPLNAAFDVAAVSPATAEPDSFETKWQDACLDALETARSADHLIRDILTTSATPAVPRTALPQLQQKLSYLNMEVRNLQKL